MSLIQTRFFSSRLLLIAISVCVFASVNAYAGLESLFTGQETRGKLPVKLHKKFTVTVPKSATGLAWSPDGSALAVTSNYGLIIAGFDSTGRKISQFERQGNKGPYLYSVAFINGPTQIVTPIETAANDNAALDIRDFITGKILKAVTVSRHSIYNMAGGASKDYSANGTDVFAVSGDQEYLAISDSTNIVIYDIKRDWKELLSTAIPYEYGVASLCFFPDSKKLLVGTLSGRTVIIDSGTGEMIHDFHSYSNKYGDYVEGAIAVSPKGDLFLTGTRGGAMGGDNYDAATPSEFKAWSKRNEEVRIWRVGDGTQVAAFSEPNVTIDQAVWDPKDRFVAFVDNGKNLFLWQPENDSFIKIKLPNFVTGLAITQDGGALAITQDNDVTVYTIENN